MKMRRSLIIIGIPVLAAVSLTTATLMQRQWAYSRNGVAEHSFTKPLVTQSQRITPDGLEFERTLVPDAPFSATQIIETSEPLADGNTTIKTSTSMIYRDSEGRTRRDLFSPQPSSAARNDSPTTSIINDPILGFSYRLDHRASVVRRAVFVIPRNDTRDSSSNSGRQEAPTRGQDLPIPSASGAESGLRVGTGEKLPGMKTEALGARDVEGLLAEGTRISMRVPKVAGDNEQPLEIVMERWYSPALHTVVLVKRNDPRRGPTTYRLHRH